MSSYNQEAPVLDTYAAVVSAFIDFLTVAIHTILYERDIYPRTSFLKARKYNYPVRQSRHPKVCSWIQDAVSAVRTEMLKVRWSFRILDLDTAFCFSRWKYFLSCVECVSVATFSTQFILRSSYIHSSTRKHSPVESCANLSHVPGFLKLYERTNAASTISDSERENPNMNQEELRKKTDGLKIRSGL